MSINTHLTTVFEPQKYIVEALAMEENPAMEEEEEEEKKKKNAAAAKTTTTTTTTTSASELFVRLVTTTREKKATKKVDEEKDDMETFIAAVSRENQHSRTDVVSAARDCRDFPSETVLIDARSPGEFRKGHIPNACNVALFEDEEREVVGTLFAKRGRKAAMVKGMDFVREKWEELIEKAQREVDEKKKSRGNNETKKKMRVYVHCWRGGMRSLSLGWLFGEQLRKEDVEFVHVVNGGYKAFRTWVLSRCGFGRGF